MWGPFKGDLGANGRKMTQVGKCGHSLAFLAP
jgi:hypothetical protein